MSKKFVVEGALCQCLFGAVPCKLEITDQKFAYINGKKLIATDKNVGNVFMSPAFGVCNKSFPSKACTAMITQWNGSFTKIKINRVASPLLEDSRGTCAIGGSDCIQFVMNGQIEIPAMPQIKKASSEFQGDMDPAGESLALNEYQITGIKGITIQ